MASSPPVKTSMPGERPGESPPPPATKWPKWRVTMLVGAVVMLVASVLQAAVDDFPTWVLTALFWGGYLFLSYGFFTALSARRRGSTPRDRG